MVYFLPLITTKGDVTMAMPKLYSVSLTEDDVSLLKSMLHKRSTNDTLANRCRILHDLDEGGINSVITLKRSANSDQTRRKVDGRAEAMIIATACGPAPEGRARWTIRLLEDHMKVLLDTPVSREAIRRALKKGSTANCRKSVHMPRGDPA